MDKKIYVFYLDGTICTNSNGEYEKCIPYQDRIKDINHLYDLGHKIIIYTARGMGRFSSNVDFCYDAYYDITYEQLKNWNVHFHELRMGKISYDYWIDDKAFNDKEFFREDYL